ncbi:hypothetical protein GCM10020220_109610 [Nonomuraea rubra]
MLGATPAVIQLPWGVEADFKGVIDLIKMKGLIWSAEAAKGEMYDTVDIPADHAEAAREWRDRLIETVAENDDELMELFLEGTEPTEEQLVAAIRRATLASAINPVLCGTAFKNKGVQPLLDAIVAYLPAPTDIPAFKGHAVGNEEKVIERHADPTESRSPLSPSRSPATRTWARSPTSASTRARSRPVHRSSTL